MLASTAQSRHIRTPVACQGARPVQLPSCRPRTRAFASVRVHQSQRHAHWQLSPRPSNLACAASTPEAQAEADAQRALSEEEDFDLLQTKVDALAKELKEGLKGTNVYLVGMMGTGKTTVGRLLSFCLGYCFFDSDDVIEKYHQGTTVADIFKNEGEDYFRTCETEVLKQLSPYKNIVVATGGGAVVKPQNWSYMQHGVVVWLSGSPDLLAQRVVAEGPEKRPLLWAEGVTQENVLQVTKEKLEKIYADRKDRYSTADIVVSLEGAGKDAATGAPTPVVLYRLMTALNEKLVESAREKEERKNFKIEGLDGVSSMQVRPAKDAAAPEE